MAEGNEAKKGVTRMEGWAQSLLDLSKSNRLLNIRESSKVLHIAASSPAQMEDAIASNETLRVKSYEAILGKEEAKAFAELSSSEAAAKHGEKIAKSLKSGEIWSMLGEKDTARRMKEIYRATRNDFEDGGVNTLFLALGVLEWSERRETRASCLVPSASGSENRASCSENRASGSENRASCLVPRASGSKDLGGDETGEGHSTTDDRQPNATTDSATTPENWNGDSRPAAVGCRTSDVPENSDAAAKPSNHQTTKPSNYQTTKPSNHQTTKPPNHQTTKPSNSSSASRKTYRAPIILVPVRMERGRVADGYRIHRLDEDASVNVTLLEMLRREYDLAVEGLDPVPQDEAGVDVQKIFAIMRNAIAGVAGLAVCEDCYIGQFSFGKFVMWKDLTERMDAVAANPIIKHLIERSGRYDDGIEVFPAADVAEHTDYSTLCCPLGADSSQLAAVVYSGMGKSFVLHGPPGTGKSQTITNIIAHNLWLGKRVLFVSEKRAALDVVYTRLARLGLAPFCLQLHSNKSGKAEVYAQFKEAMDSVNSLQFGVCSLQFAAADAAKKTAASPQLQTENCKLKTEKNCKLQTEENCKLQTEENCKLQTANCKLQTEENCKLQTANFKLQTAIAPVNRQLDAYVKALHKRTASGFTPYDLFARLVRGDFEGVCSLQFAVCSGGGRDFILSSDSDMSRKNAASPQLQAANTANTANCKLQTANSSRITAVTREEYEEAQRCIVALAIARQGIPAAAVAALKDVRPFTWTPNAEANLVRQAEDIAQRLKTSLAAYEIRQDATFAEKLKAYALRGTRFVMRQWKGEDFELGGVRRIMDELSALMETGGAGAAECIAKAEAAAANASGNLRRVFMYMEERRKMPAVALGIAEKIDAEDAPDGEAWARKFALSFQKTLLDDILEHEPEFGTFSGLGREKLMQRLRELDDERSRECIAKLKAKLAKSIREGLDGAPTGRTGRVAKNSELGLLMHECGKKMRHKPVRQILAETPNLAPILKPCFLMSPLSVAQYLDVDADFDLVVFDEASQIPVWDAVDVIARGRQLIMVGDPKQLPPTSFFRKTNDDEEQAEDLESILDECMHAGLMSCYLSWHFRSRHESLISFSNERYYEDRLHIFPAAKSGEYLGVRFVHVPDGVYDARSSRTNRREAEVVADIVVKRLTAPECAGKSLGVVTFSEAQRNLIEDIIDERRAADATLDAAFAAMQDEPFFVKNLENVQGDERDAIIFSIGYAPDASGKFNMVFGPLSNNGGERRLNVAITRAKEQVVVVSSIHGYQIDVSRISSRGPADLRAFLEYAERNSVPWNRGEGQSTTDGRQPGATTDSAATPESQNVDCRPAPVGCRMSNVPEKPSAASAASTASTASAPDVFAGEIAAFLEAHGAKTMRDIGCGGMRVDVAVVDPLDATKYTLGVICDGESYAAENTTRDRDRLRDDVLSSLGWRLHHAWIVDWAYDRENAEKRLLAAAGVR